MLLKHYIPSTSFEKEGESERVFAIVFLTEHIGKAGW